MNLSSLYNLAMRELSNREMEKLGLEKLQQHLAPFKNMGVKKDKKTRRTLKQFVADEERRYDETEKQLKHILDKTEGKTRLLR